MPLLLFSSILNPIADAVGCTFSYFAEVALSLEKILINIYYGSLSFTWIFYIAFLCHLYKVYRLTMLLRTVEINFKCSLKSEIIL